jgi:hypothetical protein
MISVWCEFSKRRPNVLSLTGTYWYLFQCCQVAAVTAIFLKCGSFEKLNGREMFLAGKMAVIGLFLT